MKKLTLVRTIILAGSLLLQLSTLCFHARGAAGDVDFSFDPGSGVNNQVRLIAPQPDGKVIIAGAFSTVRGLRRLGIARINSDGTGDATFDAGSAGARHFSSLALEPDGSVLLAAEDGLIRLDSGGRGEARINIETYEKLCFSHGCSYGINTFVVQPDGRILIGGYFLTRNGAATNYGIARILPDGRIDSEFSATVAPPEEDRPTSDGVSGIELLPDGKVVITGYFDLINGVPRPGIARLHSDGRLDESFDPTGVIRGNVYRAEAQSDGKLLVSGPDFTNFGRRPVIARLNTDGTLDTGFHFATSVLDFTHAVVLQPDGRILVSGYVNTFGWEGKRLIRLMPDGSLDQTFHAEAAAGRLTTVLVVAVQSDKAIVIGGQINAPEELRRNGLARLHPDGSLDTGFRSDTGLTGIRTPGVRSVAVQEDGKVLIAGSWVRIAGPSAFGITRLHPDGMPDPAFSPPDGMNVQALALQPDGSILIGEDLRWAADPIRSAVRRLLPGGEPDAGFQVALEDLTLPDDCEPAPLFGEVCSETFSATALAVQTDGRILIGGFRTTSMCDVCGAKYRHFVARLHPDGSNDDTFRIRNFHTSPVAPIRCLIIQPDGRVLVGGYFTAIDGWARPGVARFHPDGTIDESFVPELPGGWETFATVSLALQPDGRIVIGRDVFDFEQFVRHEIARLNPDGSSDASFNAEEGVNGAVYSIAVQPDGKLILAGDFTSVGGAGHDRITRLHPDGSVDGAFIAFTAGIGAEAAVYAMAVTADGGVFIGGEFDSVNGLARPGLAKLHAGPGGGVSFGTWVARFGHSGPDAAAGADPDGDGLPNAAEYILGANPATPDRWNRPAATADANDMIFTFLRDDVSETPDVTLTVESGSDLVTWPTVFTIGPNTAASSPGVSITENGTAPDTITVTIPQSTDQAKFARLKVAIVP